jgi:hypothetical protein
LGGRGWNRGPSGCVRSRHFRCVRFRHFPTTRASLFTGFPDIVRLEAVRLLERLSSLQFHGLPENLRVLAPSCVAANAAQHGVARRCARSIGPCNMYGERGRQ